LKRDEIEEYEESAKSSVQKKRIVVTDLGSLVNDYLYKVIPDMLNTNFTANVESDLDLVSNGKMDWLDVIKKIYEIFNPIIIDQMDDKIICRYDEDNVYLKEGRYGEYLRYKDKNYNIQGYLKYKKIEANDLDLEDCKTVIKYPLKICKHKKDDVCIHIGPYGYYMKYGKKNFKIDQNSKLWTKGYILGKI